jgi:hypothetical protein
MNPLSDRLGRERHTMATMVEIYCNSRHGHAEPPYGTDKPTCANCPIHCYKAGPRARAKMIMRYAGPRMLFRHPYLTITHKIDGFIAAKHPNELTRDERSQLRER